MIDTSTFTQEQQWGLAFGTQQYNAAQPEGTTPLSVEEYCKLLLSNNANAFYAALMEYKKTITIEAFNSAPPEKQQQVFTILEVPDVLS